MISGDPPVIQHSSTRATDMLDFTANTSTSNTLTKKPWQRSLFNFQAPDSCFTQPRPTMQNATKLMQCSHYWTECGHAVISVQSSLFSCCFCLFSRAHSIGSLQVFYVYSILYWTFSSLYLSYNRSSPMSASTQSQSKERFCI